MTTLVQIDFEHHGPFLHEMYQAYKQLAEDIAEEPGLIWKVWTENPGTNEAGGVYLFETEVSALKYVEKHTKRLESFGVLEPRCKVFGVNQELSLLTKFL